jgi:hypothetical protein
MQQSVEDAEKVGIDKFMTLERQKHLLEKAKIPDTEISRYLTLDGERRFVLINQRNYKESFKLLLERYDPPKDTEGGRRRRKNTKRNRKSRKSRKSSRRS